MATILVNSLKRTITEADYQGITGEAYKNE